MDINLSLSPAPSITTNYLVVAVYDASAPTTVVSYQAFAAPHTSSVNIVFTGLDPVVYKVVTYENATNVPGGTVRHNFIYDPSFQNAEYRLDLFLIVGTTAGMTAGATTYQDASLKDWEYSIELRQSYGTLQPGVDWDYLSGPPPYGFQIMLLDYTFQPDEVYVLHFYPKITTFTPVAVSSNLFSNAVVHTADATLTNTDIGKVHLLQSATAKISLTLPALSAVTALKLISFISDGGSHINATLVTAGSDKVQFLNGSQSKVYMGQSERICLFKYGSYWNVFHADGNYSTVGAIIHQYLTAQLNTVFADGSLLVRANYPRLWAYVQTLDSSELVNDTDWSNVSLNYKAKYSTGDGSTTFRVPLLYTHGFLRGVDGSTRKAGTYQVDDLAPHTHTYPLAPSGGIAGALVYGRGGASIATGTTNSSGGAETRPKNTAVYLLINI